MKFALALAAAGAILSASDAVHAQDIASPEATRLALAQDVVTHGFPEDTRMDAMVGLADQMIEQMYAANPDLRTNRRLAGVMDRFRVRVVGTAREVLADHIDDMMSGMAEAYAASFTEEELVAIRTFMMSPAGHGFLTRMIDINSHPAYAAANQRYMNDYMTHLPALQAEFQSMLAEALSK